MFLSDKLEIFKRRAKMNKKVLSKILLCFIFLTLISMVVIFINTGISLYQLENTEIDTSNDIFPGASVIGAVFSSIGLWLGFVIISGITSSIGLVCSFVNVKITRNSIIHRISKAFLYFYFVVLLLIFFLFVVFVVCVF